MSNKSESIQKAIQWAFQVRADVKNPFVERFCAGEVLTAIDNAKDSTEVAYDALAAILKDWQGKRKDSMNRPIQRLSRALRLGEESTVDG